MLRIIFLIIMTVHGLIHLMGFVQAFRLAEMKDFTLQVSKPAGIVWLAATLLFVIAAVLFLLNNEAWWAVAGGAVVLSQILIIAGWQDAKFGTLANLIVLLVVVVAFARWNFHQKYQQDVKHNLARTMTLPRGLLTEDDLTPLPAPVQRYIRYCGCLGREKVVNFKAEFVGDIRSKDGPWMPFTCEQYNFVDVPTRLFFIKAVMKGVPADGYHAFKDGRATMLIKVLSLIPMIDAKGEVMNISETVTLFNDLCVMAPSALIDPRIRWEAIDDLTAKGFFTHNGVTVSAALYFDDQGRLVNWISDDRYALEGKSFRNLRWSTPISEYINLGGYTLPAKADLIYDYPEGPFCYGRFTLKNMRYNVVE